MRDAKAIALESVMRHPELSKLLKDAHASPQGSTLRKKARQVLNSTYQASYNKYKPVVIEDGQGGVAPTTTQSAFTPMPINNNLVNTSNTAQQPTYSGSSAIKSPFKDSSTFLPPTQDSAQTSQQYFGGLAVDAGKTVGSGAYRGAKAAGAGFGSAVLDPFASMVGTGIDATYAGGNAALGVVGSGLDKLSKANPLTLSNTLMQNNSIKDIALTAFRKWLTKPKANNPATQMYNNELDQGYVLAAAAVKAGQKASDMIAELKKRYPKESPEAINTGLNKKLKALGVQVSPSSQYQSLDQNTKATAPVFKANLSTNQKTSINNLIEKIAGGYKPNPTDIKNLTYALGPNWQQSIPTNAQDPRVSNRLGAVSAVNGPATRSSNVPSYGQSVPVTSTTGEDTHAHGPEPMAGVGDGSTANSQGSNGAQAGGIQDWMLGKWQEGIGSDSAAQIAMNDKNLVAQALGVPVDTLPDSLLLGDQYQEIEEALRKNYGLDNKENEILTRQRNGKNLGSILEDYMTERDTYINTLNNTLDTAKAWFNNRGADNPYAIQSRDRYIGFLTTLKGGQQKRYADFLKMSTDMYGQETQALTDDYNIQKQKFDTQLANSKLSTQEEYNTMKGVLKGMYDRYDTIIDRQTKIANLNAKGVSLNGDIASNVIDNSSNMLSFQTKDAELLDSWAPKIFKPTTIKGLAPGDPDLVLYNKPIAEAMDIWANSAVTEAGRAGDPTAVITFYDNQIGSAMDSFFVGDKSGNSQKIVNNYQNVIDQYLKTAYPLATTAAQQTAVFENAKQLAGTLSSKVSSSVLGELNNKMVLSDTQQAIQDLAFEHKMFGGKRERTSAEITPAFIDSWKKQHSNVPSLILDGIIAHYNVQVNVKDPSGQTLNNGPKEALLMSENQNDPNHVQYYEPNQLDAKYLSDSIITKGILAQLFHDTLI